ncbi:hypothetical protein C0J52_13352 [Blattella germanica]|nr:hypothetical protein C0J52_13352 [Blattella germanica]
MSLPATFVPGFHNEEAVRKMQYNPLGNTGLKISKIGFGGAALGGRFLFGEYEEAEGIATVHEALKQGINFIDTAPYYGQGRSEELLGKALKGVPRKAYYIATKVARYEMDILTRFDFSKEKTLWSVDNSLKKLGLDYVDIIQTLPALASVVQAGKARYIGITCHTLSVLKEAIQRSPVPISTVLSYARNTLIDDSLLTFVPYFQDHGIELAKLAQYHTMSSPGPATQLVGMNNRKELQANIDVAVIGLTDLEQQVLKDIKSKFLDKLKPTHWEGFEVKQYEEALKQKK